MAVPLLCTRQEFHRKVKQLHKVIEMSHTEHASKGENSLDTKDVCGVRCADTSRISTSAYRTRKLHLLHITVCACVCVRVCKGEVFVYRMVRCVFPLQTAICGIAQHCVCVCACVCV